MNVKELLRIGAEAFLSSLNKPDGVNADSANLSITQVMQAMAQLFPGQGKKVDLGALIREMQSGSLAPIVKSWLSNSGNHSINADQLMDLFGKQKIRAFANQLGLSEANALNGLQSAVPSMVDKASADGTLNALSGVSGIIGGLSGLLGRK